MTHQDLEAVLKGIPISMIDAYIGNMAAIYLDSLPEESRRSFQWQLDMRRTNLRGMMSVMGVVMDDTAAGYVLERAKEKLVDLQIKAVMGDAQAEYLESGYMTLIRLVMCGKETFYTSSPKKDM